MEPGRNDVPGDWAYKILQHHKLYASSASRQCGMHASAFTCFLSIDSSRAWFAL